MRRKGWTMAQVRYWRPHPTFGVLPPKGGSEGRFLLLCCLLELGNNPTMETPSPLRGTSPRRGSRGRWCLLWLSDSSTMETPSALRATSTLGEALRGVDSSGSVEFTPLAPLLGELSAEPTEGAPGKRKCRGGKERARFRSSPKASPSGEAVSRRLTDGAPGLCNCQGQTLQVAGREVLGLV